MGRGCDRRQTVLGGEGGHRAAQADKLRTRLARGVVHAGADLDLGFQELARHLALHCLLRGLEQGLGHLTHEIAGGLLDEEVFLLDADRERWVL